MYESGVRSFSPRLIECEESVFHRNRYSATWKLIHVNTCMWGKRSTSSIYKCQEITRTIASTRMKILLNPKRSVKTLSMTKAIKIQYKLWIKFLRSNSQSSYKFIGFLSQTFSFFFRQGLSLQLVSFNRRQRMETSFFWYRDVCFSSGKIESFQQSSNSSQRKWF